VFFEDLHQLLIESETSHALLHAGAVAFGDNLVVVPGSSHSGKSTLTAALLDVGGSYYSDEQAIVATDGTVAPFPRPLQIRDARFLPKRGEDVTYGGPPLPPRLVVLTAFQPGAEWDPLPMSSGEALMAVLRHSITVRSRPEVTMRALGAMVSSATCLAGPRGDARETAARIAAVAAS
jgi:hypothetical protein